VCACLHNQFNWKQTGCITSVVQHNPASHAHAGRAA
jgi:hypothetical protein